MRKTALLAFIAILISDQLTKMLALKFLSSGPIAILPFFNLVLVYNRGISFGMLSDQGEYGPLLLTITSLAIIGGLIIWQISIREKHLYLAVWAIIAGALGNVIDRVRYQAVIDFIDFHALGWHYPAFNIADSAIVLGIAFVLYDSIFLEAKRNKA